MEIDSLALGWTTLNPRSLVLTMTGNPVQVTVSPLTVSSLTGVVSTGVVTVVTSVAHQLVVGQFVTISGATDGRYDGDFAVTTVANGTTFTYQLPSRVTGNTNFGTLITPDTNSGPALVSYRIQANSVWIQAPAHALTFGPASDAGATIPIAANAVGTFQLPVGTKFYLDNMYLVGTNLDVVRIMYV